MSEEYPRRTHIIKRVTLPSGKEVDITSSVPEHQNPEDCSRLCICWECSGTNVKAYNWEEIGPTGLRVRLSCDDCGQGREEIVSDIDYYDYERACDIRQNRLAEEEKQRFAEYADTFARLLNGGHILPEDF